MAQQTDRILEARGGAITLDVTFDTVAHTLTSVHGVNSSGSPCTLTVTDVANNRTASRTFASGTDATWTPPAGLVPWAVTTRPVVVEMAS